jgi:anti-sigma factor RsiW
MQCTQTRDLTGAYADGELDLAAGADVARHLEECPRCAALYSQTLRVSRAAHDPELRYQAPDELKRRVLAAVAGTQRPGVGRMNRQIGPVNRWWWAVAAAIALAAGTAYLVIEANRSSTNDAIAGEVVSSHVRSLLASHMLDVVSSDRHTVKPWFAGKLDYSLEVPDLGREGFELAGGRLDYVGKRPTAALIYRRREHVINVFVWPHNSGPPADGRARSLQGYNVINWTDGKMDAWAVSDLNEPELQDFTRRLRSAIEAPATIPAKN